jgi:hypothetical protein
VREKERKDRGDGFGGGEVGDFYNNMLAAKTIEESLQATLTDFDRPSCS